VVAPGIEPGPLELYLHSAMYTRTRIYRISRFTGIFMKDNLRNGIRRQNNLRISAAEFKLPRLTYGSNVQEHIMRIRKTKAVVLSCMTTERKVRETDGTEW
jgi:hypothetical protein